VTLTVIKIGGASAAGAMPLVAGAKNALVVHGAGPQITKAMEQRGLIPTFERGRRVTTPDVLDVVRECFAAVNAQLCATIGPRAVGLMGDEIGLRATRLPELGLVGHPEPCAPAAVVNALQDGLIPVVAPLAEGPLNVNADEAAAALAVGLGAERIVFVTDVPGVLLGSRVLESMSVERAEELLPGFEGGIVPKLQAAIRAARLGVHAEIGQTAVVA
jgi:acetylglutamate kinase